MDKRQSQGFSNAERQAGTAEEGFLREVQVTGGSLGLRSVVCVGVTAESEYFKAALHQDSKPFQMFL